LPEVCDFDPETRLDDGVSYGIPEDPALSLVSIFMAGSVGFGRIFTADPCNDDIVAYMFCLASTNFIRSLPYP
jgi:hypothetical protein